MVNIQLGFHFTIAIEKKLHFCPLSDRSSTASKIDVKKYKYYVIRHRWVTMVQLISLITFLKLIFSFLSNDLTPNYNIHKINKEYVRTNAKKILLMQSILLNSALSTVRSSKYLKHLLMDPHHTYLT